MINNNIINKFQLLIYILEYINDNNSLNYNEKLKMLYRIRSFKNSLSIIKKYPKQLTLSNLKDLQQIPGIGKSTINKIQEILTTNDLAELSNYKINNKLKIIQELETVVGIGHKTAFKLMKKGIKSIKDLKIKIKKKEIKVNNIIKLGLKYYGKFFENIPRNEIDEINIIIKDVIDNMNKIFNLKKDNKYIYEICGSYRRKKNGLWRY